MGQPRSQGSNVTRLMSLTLALALVATACGSGSAQGVASLDDTAATTTTTPEEAAASMEEATLAFTECLREHGLEVEDPEFDGQGGFGIVIGPGSGSGPAESGPDEETRAAMEACQPLMEGVRSQFEAIDPSEMQDQMYAFAECMRDQGIDWPDPDLTAFGPGLDSAESDAGDGGGIVTRGPFGDADIDFEDPAVQAALEVCQEELGFGGRVGVGGPGGPGAPGGPGGTSSGGQGS